MTVVTIINLPKLNAINQLILCPRLVTVENTVLIMLWLSEAEVWKRKARMGEQRATAYSFAQVPTS